MEDKVDNDTDEALVETAFADVAAVDAVPLPILLFAEAAKASFNCLKLLSIDMPSSLGSKNCNGAGAALASCADRWER